MHGQQNIKNREVQLKPFLHFFVTYYKKNFHSWSHTNFDVHLESVVSRSYVVGSSETCRDRFPPKPNANVRKIVPGNLFWPRKRIRTFIFIKFTQTMKRQTNENLRRRHFLLHHRRLIRIGSSNVQQNKGRDKSPWSSQKYSAEVWPEKDLFFFRISS